MDWASSAAPICRTSWPRTCRRQGRTASSTISRAEPGGAPCPFSKPVSQPGRKSSGKRSSGTGAAIRRYRPQYRLINPCIWLEEARADEATEYEEPPIADAPDTDPADWLQHPAFADWRWRPASPFSHAIRRQANGDEVLLKLALEQFDPEVARATAPAPGHGALAGPGRRCSVGGARRCRGHPAEEREPEACSFAVQLVKAGFELERPFYSTIGR